MTDVERKCIDGPFLLKEGPQEGLMEKKTILTLPQSERINATRATMTGSTRPPHHMAAEVDRGALQWRGDPCDHQVQGNWDEIMNVPLPTFSQPIGRFELLPEQHPQKGVFRAGKSVKPVQLL